MICRLLVLWFALSVVLAPFVGRILKYCSMFDSDAVSEIDAAKAWSEVHEEFPINSGA